MRFARLALSASVFVAVSLTSAHGHPGGAEYPQRCSVCVSAGQASLQTPPAAVPVVVAIVRVSFDAGVVSVVPVVDLFSPQLSRAPPA